MDTIQNSGNAIERVPTASLCECAENWEIYTRPRLDDPAFIDLCASIEQAGIQTPLHVSQDDYVLSGHRRLHAAVHLGLELVPVIRENVMVEGMEKGALIKLLISHNQGQRVKTDAEAFLEAAATIDPETAVREAREAKSQLFAKAKSSATEVFSTGSIRRTDPTGARHEILEAVKDILVRYRAEMGPIPMSARSIHYQLLSRKVRTSTYASGYVYGSAGKDSAGLLSKLLTDARSCGEIDADWINDDTRPSIEYPSEVLGAYIHDECRRIFNGYYSDIHVDQPHHVEILLEKNTLYSLLSHHVSDELRVPITSQHGYGSFPPARDVAKRFRRTGKEQLIIIYVSDLDPEGVDMPVSFKKYLAHDFGVTCTMLRAAVTIEQISKHNLPPDADVKLTSSRAGGFLKQYGEKCWELDSMPPKVLVEEVRAVVEGCLDMDAFRRAQEREQEADVKLKVLRQLVTSYVREMAPQLLKEGAA